MWQTQQSLFTKQYTKAKKSSTFSTPLTTWTQNNGT